MSKRDPDLLVEDILEAMQVTLGKSHMAIAFPVR